MSCPLQAPGTAEGASPAFSKHQEGVLSQGTYHVHYNSGVGAAAPTRLWETSGQEWGAAQRQHTEHLSDTWQMAKRTARWGEMGRDVSLQISRGPEAALSHHRLLDTSTSTP